MVETQRIEGNEAPNTNESIIDSVAANNFRVLSEDTIAYMREKHIPEIMEFIMRSIINQKPECPYAFLHKLTSTPYLPHIIIAGPPSTNVQTHGEQITQFYKQKKNIRPVYISTGELIRDEIDNGTDAGKIAEDLFKNNKLVPDSLVIGLLRNRLQKNDVKENGWILEGFPRTLKQVEVLEAEGYTPDLYIQLVADDTVVMERLILQRVDSATQVVYHLKTNPPPENDMALLGRLIQRDEDTPNAVQDHLNAYGVVATLLAKHYDTIRVCQNANLPLSEALKETDKTLEKHHIN